MTSPLGSLDAFLESPESQRDVTRVVRMLVNEARSMVLCFGDERAPALAATLARTFPSSNVHAILIEANPTRVTPMFPGSETMELPERSVLDALRSCLRQDADLIAVDHLDATSGPMICQAMFTGHLVIVGATVTSLDEGVTLLSPEEGLRATVKGSIDCAIRLANGHIRSVTSKTGEVVRECVFDRSLLPTREPVTPPAPVFAPPISARVATVSPRRAFLPVTGSSSNRSALVTSSALRPTTWPVCRSCQQPLVHVVTLDTAELPLPAGAGLVQLFLCGHGCDTTNEAAPGVLLERLEGDVGSVDGSLKPDVLAAGTIVDCGWRSTKIPRPRSAATSSEAGLPSSRALTGRSTTMAPASSCCSSSPKAHCWKAAAPQGGTSTPPSSSPPFGHGPCSIPTAPGT